MLLVQGFQRAFVELGNPAFSVSATMRRSTCEQILKFARASGWSIMHSYLGTDRSIHAASALDGFTPLPGEMYGKQQTLSAFRNPSFEAKWAQLESTPIYLISFAGVGAIGATFFDALERQLPLHIVTNAIADAGRTEISERLGIVAIEAVATAFNRAVRWPDLEMLNDRGRKLRSIKTAALPQVENSRKPIDQVVQELAGLLLMAQYIFDEVPSLVEYPTELSGHLEAVIIELEKVLVSARGNLERHRCV